MNLSSEGDLQFPPEGAPVPGAIAGPWKLPVVDNEPEVHLITRRILQDYSFENRCWPTPDIAVVLLDVVMETDHSGLDLVWIILRIGQPGAAPEKRVILE